MGDEKGRGGEEKGVGSVLISTCKCPGVSAVAAEKDFISVLRPSVMGQPRAVRKARDIDRPCQPVWFALE